MSSEFALIRSRYRICDNVSDPQHYQDDFSTDKGYFTEENNTKNWKISDGKLTTTAGDDSNIIYLHIFEQNATFKARVRIAELNPPNSMFGLMLRYNSDAAFVRCGAFVVSGKWFIDSSEGADFFPERLDMVQRPINVGEWFDLEFSVCGTKGILKVDGETVVSVNDIRHLSPGRVGIWAERMTLEVDSIDVSFDSGEGTLWRDVVHNKLPDNQYREGGSVFEMSDGKLVYQHSNKTTFTSVDNGKTWERAELWNKHAGYVNMLRLVNGEFMKIAYINNIVTVHISKDDGASWEHVTDICPLQYTSPDGIVAGGGNMNDKITQSATTGRIFYSQNYQTRGNVPLEGKMVFCRFFYSDDNGRSWTKSETDSWDIPGNDKIYYFGECKFLECDDGTVRMYNSWNTYGCIVYSDSNDGGKTFGPLKKMPEFVCARSSMQFWRDPYAENKTTYYMVWPYSAPTTEESPHRRTRLSLAMSKNGKDWDYLGDVWRWEHGFCRFGEIAHIVDPFVMTNRDYVICGSGFSEQLAISEAGDYIGHHAQRQHIYSIKKSSLKAKPLPPV